MPVKHKICGYCGKPATDLEHVIPSCLYPDSARDSRVQRLTIPACRSCNQSWADDEAHFRNVLTLCGNPTSDVSELWHTTVRRSFRQPDGRRRLSDLYALLTPVTHGRKVAHKVYPTSDPRFMRVLRKIVRGLHFWHTSAALPDRLVWCDVLRYEIPPELLDATELHHRIPQIFSYRLQRNRNSQPEFVSAWLLTFYESRSFVALGLSESSASLASPAGG